MENLAGEFEDFWKQYPRHVGKLAAYKAYRKARSIATAAELLDGISRYRAGKPSYADWCHAATFLNRGSWMDEYDTRPVGQTTEVPDHLAPDWCQHTPRCCHRAWHLVVLARERGEA